MLTPETILQDRYRILRQLGQGGMGAVYEAVDQRLDTTVALKETLFTEEKLRRQFEREARLLARLHHPALPRVSDHFAEGEGAFLVMQYIAGDDLAEMINLRRGPFPIEQVLLWADQLLDALDYLHTQDPQIIHRDIKPQNLKLSARGQIILLDFGLAKGQVGEVSRVSTASIFGYTPNYAPLEQIQGLGTDPRSDIYALAATLYHLLTGVKPPDALSRAAALVNGQPDPLLPANQIQPSIGTQISAVLVRAMSQNRDQRYPSAAAMRSAMQAGNEVTIGGRDEAATVLFSSPPPAPTRLVSANETVPATVPSTGETTVMHALPRAGGGGLKWAAAAAGLVLLLCVGGAGYYYVAERSKTNTAAVTPSPSPITNVSTLPPSPSPEASAAAPASGTNTAKEKQAEPAKDTHKKPEATKPDEEAQRDKNEAKREAEQRKREEEQRRADQERERAERDAEAEKEKQKNKHPDPPDTPDPGYVEVPGPNGQGRRRIPTVRSKTLPDGTKVMITPDGTRIVTLPDGSIRVFRPTAPKRRQRP
ncbi:MAG TPA: protein kinase [Pyrinomonadaceae bacterium]|nr:protein kinase [Pyrinomonadaceae bacterium]